MRIECMFKNNRYDISEMVRIMFKRIGIEIDSFDTYEDLMKFKGKIQNCQHNLFLCFHHFYIRKQWIVE